MQLVNYGIMHDFLDFLLFCKSMWQTVKKNRKPFILPGPILEHHRSCVWKFQNPCSNRTSSVAWAALSTVEISGKWAKKVTFLAAQLGTRENHDVGHKNAQIMFKKDWLNCFEHVHHLQGLVLSGVFLFRLRNYESKTPIGQILAAQLGTQENDNERLNNAQITFKRICKIVL
jgi:hypothetical protein